MMMRFACRWTALATVFLVVALIGSAAPAQAQEPNHCDSDPPYVDPGPSSNVWLQIDGGDDHSTLDQRIIAAVTAAASDYNDNTNATIYYDLARVSPATATAFVILDHTDTPPTSGQMTTLQTKNAPGVATIYPKQADVMSATDDQLKKLALHEMGHTWGLRHPAIDYSWQQMNCKIMNPSPMLEGRTTLANTEEAKTLEFLYPLPTPPPPTPTADPGPRGYYPGGISGSYYNDTPPATVDIEVPIYWNTFTSLVLSRTDARIDFNSGTSSPAPDVNGTFWSARWHGQLYAPATGNYTFYLVNLDDGGRLWIDNVLDGNTPLIDSWRVQGYHDYQSASVSLAVGLHNFRVDYAQGPAEGGALTVQWSSDSFDRETIGPYGAAVPTVVATTTITPTPTPTSTPTLAPSPTPTATSTPVPTVAPSPTPAPTPDNCWCPIFWLFGWCQPASAQGFASSLSAVQAVRSAADDLQLFYSVRDAVLATTPEGRRLTALYNQHGPEVTRRLQADPHLAVEARLLLQLWTPALQALVRGQRDRAVVTREQVAATQRFMEHLSVNASPELKRAVAHTLARHPLNALVGKNMREALERDDDDRDHDGRWPSGRKDRKE